MLGVDTAVDSGGDVATTGHVVGANVGVPTPSPPARKIRVVLLFVLVPVYCLPFDPLWQAEATVILAVLVEQ